MASVQVWFYAGWAIGNAGDSPLPKEPPVGYQSQTVNTTSVGFSVPETAKIAVVETDAAVAYRLGAAAVFADDPQIAATQNNRYVIDVSAGGTLHFIASA